MTAKFRQIIDQLNALITFKVDKSMSDEDFIANIDGINLLCNLYDDLGLDRSGIRRRMSNLYPEFIRRIYGKRDIQLAVTLIKAFYRFIYDRSDDRGPMKWRNSFIEMCCKVVASYRKCPLLDATEYLFALDTICRINEYSVDNDIDEYKEIIASLLIDIDWVSIAEKIRRVRAYERSKHLFISDNWEQWAAVRESLKEADFRQLDDATFILWREITDISPMKELKRRAGHSKQMQVEYLQGLIFTEFEKQRRLVADRKLNRDLKVLKDEIIGDIIPLRINAEMSNSTLYALETIFFLRLQLAQVGWEDNEQIYESLCRNRFEQIAKVFAKKYKTTKTLNEKIEILERLSAIGMLTHSSDLDFAIEEADKLKETPNLTYAQKLRLDWIPTINSENESEIVSKLLNSLAIPNSSSRIPNSEDSSFIMATLALITDFLTTEEREAVLNCYFGLFDTALSTNNTTELGKLLTLAAYWNSNPFLRKRIMEHTSQFLPCKRRSDDLTPNSLQEQSVDTMTALLTDIPLPEKRVNDIAAIIYSKIDEFTGKYDNPFSVPA